MKRLIVLLCLIGLCGGTAQGETEKETYFIQLILGTNREKTPEEKTWKEVGPKLQKALSPVFKWKHYWEVSRQRVQVAHGKPLRTRLTDARELEIERRSDGQVVLQLFREGKRVRKMKDAASKKRLIMGGDNSKDEAWFVVVRRDEPSKK